MSYLKIVIIFVITIFFSGCSSYSANRYSLSIDNVNRLEELTDKKINLGEFTSSTPERTTIMCRGIGPIETPGRKTFEEFIKQSFKEELETANIFSNNAPIILTGNLDHIDFSSNSGVWYLSLSIKSSNGKSIMINENYNYDTSFFGEVACSNTAKALIPAVQNLIGKIINHQEFESLLN